MEGLQKISSASSTKQNLPILNSVLIEAKYNIIKLTTTNLNTTIITSINTKVVTEGKVVVLLRQFTSIIRELPQQEITVELIKNNLLIKCEKIEFKINTINPDEFPKIEQKQDISLIKINYQELLYIFKLTSFCVGQEDVSYVLNGIFFELTGDSITGVSTDGKRLAVVKRKLPANQPEIKTKLTFILPLQTANELQKIIKDRDGEMFFYINHNKVGFDFKDTQVITRIIEGEFPDYNHLIPKIQQNKLKINRRNFLSALKRTILLTTPNYQSVKIELKKNQITLLKITPQVGEIREDVVCDYSGQYFPIGFNPTYVIDVLKNIDEEDVFFEFCDIDKPIVLRKNDYTYIFAQMKI